MLPLLLAIAAHAGPDADKISFDLELKPPNIERAQKRCTKWEAWRMSADPSLRDACARAFWYTTATEGKVEAWNTYRKRWAGTKGEAPALEREARALLVALGRDATEEAYLRLTRQYPGTKAADTASAMAEHMAMQNVGSDAAEALRVMNQYPERVPELLAQFLPQLVEVQVRGLSITTELHEGVPRQGDLQLQSLWAARHADGTVVPWDDEARAHLKAAGLDQAIISRLDGTASNRTARRYPLCYDPTADPGWEAGVAVRLGEASLFEAQPWSSSCTDQEWPAFVILRGDRVTGLSLQPGHLMLFPTQQATTGFTWGGDAQGVGGTDLYLPFPPGEPVTVGNAQVVGQQLGPLYLVHPIGGGLPWITDMKPPRNAVGLPRGFESTRLPKGWAVLPGPGSSSEVQSEALGATAWTLPRGDVRQLTPLVQWATGLHRHNAKLTAQVPEPLPALSQAGAWSRSRVMIQAAPPKSAKPLKLQEATPDQVQTGLRMLEFNGVDMVVLEAWAANLDDDPRTELVLVLERAGVKLRAFVDTYASGARRAFLFDAASVSDFDSRKGQQFSFVRGGVPYVAWTGMRGSSPFVEAVHLDDRGLVREYLK